MAFVVRWLHVAAAAFLFGGSTLICLYLATRRETKRDEERGAALDLMAAYEWGFWAAIAIIVATGVGNLAHFGEGLQGPGTRWGHKLEIKLAVVALLILFSVYRTASVALQMTKTHPTPGRLAGLYGATSVLVVGILGLAVALAHF